MAKRSPNYADIRHALVFTLVLLNCCNCIFRHLELTQFPAPNAEKFVYFFENIHLLN